MSQPHDELFRRVFADPALAADWLRGLLPVRASRLVDWQGIERLPDTFVRDRGGVLRSDLLFRVRVQPARGLPRPLYLIPEHVSTRRREVVLQALDYVLAVFQAHRREVPEDRHLPIVFVVLCHHGASSRFPLTDLLDLYGPLEERIPDCDDYLPRFRVVLDDLALQGSSQIERRAGSARLRLVLHALGRLRAGRDLGEQLDRMRASFDAAQAEEEGPRVVWSVLVYIAQVWDLTPAEMRVLVAQRLGSGTERVMTSTYDQLLNQGRAEGRAALLLDLLEARFGPLENETRQRVLGADEAELRGWALRILTAENLREVLGTSRSEEA